MSKVYLFGISDQGYPLAGDVKELLGGKGAGLAKMAALGLPVPPGLTIPTTQCGNFDELEDIIVAVKEGLENIKDYLDDDELLVSVRSGARVSMPGMMDTLLNIGLTAENLPLWKDRLGERAALDCYRRLIQMYGETVHGIDPALFSKKLAEIKSYKYGMDAAPKSDSDMSVEHLNKVIEGFEKIFEKNAGKAFKEFSVEDQLINSILAVWKSWNGERAKAYRAEHGYPDHWGTAVNIQKMVFGNMNDNSGSGVCFTRNPATGVPEYYGEFLPNAQGEDVVAGTRTPLPLDEMGKYFPEANQKLTSYMNEMENQHKDMQDMEFTVEDGKLWILQTRTGKRSALAAFRIARDMVAEETITKEEAVKRVNGSQYLALQKPQIDPSFKDEPYVTGVAAGGGLVTAKAWIKGTEKPFGAYILVAGETTPDDFSIMKDAVGILTETGGATSHAAVVARSMDKSCVVGCGLLATDDHTGVTPGATITIEGSTGRVWKGEVPTVKHDSLDFVDEIIGWALKDTDLMVRVSPEVSGGVKVWPSWSGILSEQLPTKGSIFMETNFLNNGGSTKFAIGKVLTILRDRLELGGVINVGGPTASFPEDAGFLKFLGVGGKTSSAEDGQHFAQKVKVLVQPRWKSILKDNWVLQLPEDTGAETRKVLRDAGWKMVTKISNLGDALTADGIVIVSPDFEEKIVADGASVDDLFKLLGDAGRTADVMPEVVDKDELVFAALG